MASAPSSWAISTRRWLIRGLAIEVPNKYSPSYSVFPLNIGNIKSLVNLSFKSSIITFEAPIAFALFLTRASSCSCPMSAVNVITSASYLFFSQ